MTLVLIHLHGGADGLSMVVPYNESVYYQVRPRLAVQKESLILLDKNFGLHPALAPLYPLYEQKSLAIVHAVGWRGTSHSHFEAWKQIEAGVCESSSYGDGWLSRYLALEQTSSTLHAIEFSRNPTGILKGARNVATVESLDALKLEMSQSTQSRLLRLYEHSKLHKEAVETAQLTSLLHRYSSNTPADYPDTDFGRHLYSVEQMIPILRAAVVHLNGWDTHAAQANLVGLMSELAQGLSSFTRQLGEWMHKVTIIVMTEFGRRVAENAALGTDHGQGSVMFFLGAGVKGGRVYGEWPGLERLADPGDLQITTDYRDALGAVVAARYNEQAVSKVFTGYKRQKDLGVFELS